VTERLRESATAINRARILFAHQSVGANIIQGLKEIADEIGVAPAVSEFEPSRPWTGIASARLGRNGDPRSKTDAFAAAVSQSAPAIALHKYCYVDLHRAGDPKALFDFYRERIAAITRENPATTVLHVTMPLTAMEQGVKAGIKRLLGRASDDAAHNAAREAFNDLIRGAFPGAVFDLAALESSAAQRALRADFTTDGGHLNERGRRAIAESFLVFLAQSVL
jgi:lysophospholipase L1-like esterase